MIHSAHVVCVCGATVDFITGPVLILAQPVLILILGKVRSTANYRQIQSEVVRWERFFGVRNVLVTPTY
jgi:hypothetical protein